MSCANIDLPNITYLRTISNFTNEQLSDHARRYGRLRATDSCATRVGMHFFIISGVVGILSNILMWASLNKSKLTLSPCTMIYHKGIICFEFPHMLVSMLYGFLTLYRDSIPSSYSFEVWNAVFFGGWHLGDWAKLSISSLTAFLTLERFIAVCAPSKFDCINRSVVAYGAIVCSILIGSAHFWALFADYVEFDEQSQSYKGHPTSFGGSLFLHFTVKFIYSAKIILCLTIFVLCLSISISLKRQATKIAAMSSDAKHAWMVKKRVCAFSMIIGVCTLVDHFVWVASKATSEFDTLTTIELEVSSGQSYEKAVAIVYYAGWAYMLGQVQAFLGQIVHGWKFFIYLALNRTIRNGFRKVIGWDKNEVATISGNGLAARGSHSGVNWKNGG